MKVRVPSSQTILRQFADRHAIKTTNALEKELVTIRSASLAYVVVSKAFGEIDESDLSDPAIGILLTMLHRNRDHIEAAVVTLATGCDASTEVIARTAIESSINILYILAGDRLQRLQAYFDDYLDDVDRQIDKWRSRLVGLKPFERELHTHYADRRKVANDFLRHLFESSVVESRQEEWPRSIQQRFKGAGEGMAFHTCYARLCSEPHPDAEEILRTVWAKGQDNPSRREAMALETISAARFVVSYAAYLFIRASQAFAASCSLRGSEELAAALADVSCAMTESLTAAGAGFEPPDHLSAGFH